MTVKNNFKSPAFEAIHSAASGLYNVEAIPQETMRNFDKACLSQVDDLLPLEIKALREKFNVSQPVFAHYLNTSVSSLLILVQPVHTVLGLKKGVVTHLERIDVLPVRIDFA